MPTPPVPPEPTTRPSQLHTAGAARLLIGALATDVARLGGRVRIRHVTKVIMSVLGLVVLLLSVAATAMLWALYQVPFDARSGLEGSSVVVEAANGQPLGRVGPLSEMARRGDFPDILVKAVISIEDRRFYSHWGFDPWAIVRAARANWTAGTVVEGGSTIPQQLAKLQLVGNERSMDRKLREALTAAWLDLRLGKDEILTRYLNSIYLGAGAIGMSAAARTYFDKRLSDLTLAEAAMLAGLIQAPSRYDPIRNLDAARARAAVVLDTMVETGAIDAQSASAAKSAPATPRPSVEVARAGGWFSEWIAKSELPKIAGSLKRTMRVRTTLEPEVQRLAEQAVREAIDRDGKKLGFAQGALVAMRPDGSVIAMVGGHDYNESQFNRAADAQRQAGSTFKIFVYYAALLNGYSPESSIDASPVTIGRWTPENFGGPRYGRMPLSDAFAHSVNTAAVRLAMTVGLNKVTAAARELGLTGPLKEVPSMALGTNDVTLLDMTGAFASVRAGRPKVEPWGIAALSADGGALRTLGAPAVPTNTLQQRDALKGLLHDVVDHGTGRAASLGDGVAGKTGTSQDFRDAWFIGFNDDLVVGVWVGNDDQSPMRGVTGGSVPAQIWKRFVDAAAPLAQPAANAEPSATAPAQTASPSCNMDACAGRYLSFRSSDCTYQPLNGGPRRMCDLQPRNTSDIRSHGQRAAEGSRGTSPETAATSSMREDGLRTEGRRTFRESPSEPSMALGGSGPGRQMDLPRRRFEGLRRPFGRDTFRDPDVDFGF
jgi:penicillin-binding protein 1A